MAYWTTYKRDLRALEEPGEWQPVAPQEGQAVWQKIPLLYQKSMRAPEKVEPRILKISLPFYPQHYLYEFVCLDLQPRLPRYVLAGPGGAHLLDWSNEAIYSIGRSGGFLLTEETVVDYVRFFFAHVAGRSGRYWLLESAQLPGADGFTGEHEKILNKHVLSLAAEMVTKEGVVFRLPAVLYLQGALAKTVISVSMSGQANFKAEEFVATDLPVARDQPTDAAYPGKPDFHFKDGWEALTHPDKDLREQLGKLVNHGGPLPDGSLTFQPLSFFRDVSLLRIQNKESQTEFGTYVLRSSAGLFPLHGHSTDIYEAIERETFLLSTESVIDYFLFYCTFVHGPEGPFRVITGPGDLNISRPPTENLAPQDLNTCPQDYDRLPRVLLERLIGPVAVFYEESANRWHCSSFNQYGEDLYRITFTITNEGEVELINDDMLVTGIPVEPAANRIHSGSGSGSRAAGQVITLREDASSQQAATANKYWPRYINERELESSILSECVRLQLVRALREGQGAPLVKADLQADDETLLTGLADFVYRAYPVIIIESSIPYIEQIVGDHLMRRASAATTASKVSGSPQDSSQGVIPPMSDGEMLAVSLHQWRKIVRPEAAAYQLGVTDTVTLIGCDTQAVVPNAFHRIMDMVITLDAIEPDLFRTMFCQLFDCQWPEMAANEPLWQRYVVPGDFYQPVRDMLRRRYAGSGVDDEAECASPWSPEEALAAIELRITARLSEIEVDDAPGLDELHGLGEAKAILKDLLSDIRAAVADEIGWDEVDRGMLMVGEPGTGKTLLARALARDGGVRFIHASEARWIAGTDSLSEHTLAIRSTFAEARRSAPCILFIDELDSIGNRQLFEGRNREYCTEIVNTLLQELQGVIDRKGVFVIGATNYLEYVDPALTRAGRLDQVVHVPRPDRMALVEILRFYLASFAQDNRLEDDMDLTALAGMAPGATGADIEFFVRDAARRARKEGVLIGHRHLAAAITRAPRSQRTTRVVSPEEQASTAVHEAGHAIALLLCEHYPSMLSIVSIIPRSNGSLGFTGALPNERQVLDRKGYIEYLQVVLAGRAAEELVYGKAGISSGAGGSSERSDLAIATRLATRMVCKLGFGPGTGQLRWQEQPSTAANIDAMRALLDQAYKDVVSKLTQHVVLLKVLRDALVARHELYAPELYELAATHGLSCRIPPDARATLQRKA